MGSKGYALPLVLVAISVLTLISVAAANRITREFRSLKLSELSEQAYFAAEAGFYLVRDELVRCGDPTVWLAEDKRTGTLTFTHGGETRSGGTYTIDSVQQTDPNGPVYLVKTTGQVGTAPFYAKRVISAEIKVTGKFPVNGNGCSHQYVVTKIPPGGGQ